MKVMQLKAYKRLVEEFKQKGYSLGVKDDMPIYTYNDREGETSNLTPGHYVDAINYGKIKFSDIPKKYLIRKFFLHALSGAYEDIVDYVREHPEKFDRQFFKDHIATDYYALQFELNDFEYMPLEFIDEEMVMCAMLKAINMRHIDRRGDCDDWFYSVYRRKPEVLTQDLYILGARCFASKTGGKNKFLDITPEKYRTSEFYFALCLENRTKVMEDIPESVLTTEFLIHLLNDNHQNICCFCDSALERESPVPGGGTIKFWQAAICIDGYQIANIPLNDERVDFFLHFYGSDSPEYKYCFKDYYYRYLKKKELEAHNN